MDPQPAAVNCVGTVPPLAANYGNPRWPAAVEWTHSGQHFQQLQFSVQHKSSKFKWQTENSSGLDS